MIHMVLVPLDGSPFAEHALPLAISLCRRTGATLRLVQVLPPLGDRYFWAPLPGSPLEAELHQHYRQQAKDYLDKIAQRLGNIGNLAVVSDVVHEKLDIAGTITTEAIATQADLVVMTTHGRGTVSRFWLGSVADDLLRDLPMPLLLVRPGAGLVDFSQEIVCKHLLVPLDGTDFAEGMLEPALELAHYLGADCCLLRVLRSASAQAMPRPGVGSVPATFSTAIREEQAQLEQGAGQYLASLADRLRGQGASITTKVVVAESPAAAILEEAALSRIDLIAIQTHGRHGVSRLMLGSVADKVVRGAAVPVLVRRSVGHRDHPQIPPS